MVNGEIICSRLSELGFTHSNWATMEVQVNDGVRLIGRITIKQTYSNSITANLTVSPVANSDAISKRPNPFRKTLQITFSLLTAGTATLVVQILNGQLLRTIEVEGQQGLNTVNLIQKALKMASGVLTYTLSYGNFMATRRMIIQ